jgi:anti-sigma factor RsiW
MDTCPNSNQVSAYHDGELNGSQRSAFEQHLAACPACQAELSDCRRLSAFITAAPVRRMTTRIRQDLYALAPEVGQVVYLRIAEWTTALAASVLVAASAWIFYGRPQLQSSSVVASEITPIVLYPPTTHDASEMPEDPQLVDWVNVNLAAGQNP